MAQDEDRRNFLHRIAGVCAAAPLVAHGAARAPLFEQQDLFAAGQGGYHTYRIPSVVATKRGRLLAFCEGRRGGSSDSGAIEMLMRRSTDGGRTWSAQAVVWADEENTCGNPCPVVDRRTGAIHLPQLRRELAASNFAERLLTSEERGDEAARTAGASNDWDV